MLGFMKGGTITGGSIINGATLYRYLLENCLYNPEIVFVVGPLIEVYVQELIDDFNPL